jgi:hypothetical protein
MHASSLSVSTEDCMVDATFNTLLFLYLTWVKIAQFPDCCDRCFKSIGFLLELRRPPVTKPVLAYRHGRRLLFAGV